MKTQSGFTLIEMVAVIIILAIMAATALPRFANLSGEARVASVQGLAGGLRTAVAMSKSKFLVAQSKGLLNVDMGGQKVSVVSGVTPHYVAFWGAPLGTNRGIGLALDSLEGYRSNTIGVTANFWPIGMRTSNGCMATYQSGVVSATATTANCV